MALGQVSSFAWGVSWKGLGSTLFVYSANSLSSEQMIHTLVQSRMCQA